MSNAEELSEQIAKDCRYTKEILAAETTEKNGR